MKEFVMAITVTICGFLGVNFLFAIDTWTRKADFGGTARYIAVGFSIGTKGYIGMGWDRSSIRKDFWGYDPDADTWTQKADFAGTARAAAVGFSIGSKGFVGTGNDGSSPSGDGASNLKDFWEYDPDANTWTRKADFGGTARYGAAGFSIGSKGYIGAGEESFSSRYKDFWEYDPSADTWTQKADFGGTARYAPVGFCIGDKGYMGAGTDRSSGFHDFWEYDPASDAWTRKADFGGLGGWGNVGFAIGTRGYIGTGYNDPAMRGFWEYDPSADKWTQRADFGGTGRAGAVGFSIQGKGYIGTGEYRDYVSETHYIYRDCWEYTALAAGDVNGDRSIDLADVIMTLQVSTGIVPSQAVYRSAAVGQKGIITSADTIFVLQKIAEMREAE